jgi:hypothetical protein
MAVLLQYFSLWLLAALMLVLPADPVCFLKVLGDKCLNRSIVIRARVPRQAITLFSATFFVTALHGFYAAVRDPPAAVPRP